MSKITVIESEQLGYPIGPFLKDILGNAFNVTSKTAADTTSKRDGVIVNVDAVIHEPNKKEYKLTFDRIEVLRRVMLNLRDKI